MWRPCVNRSLRPEGGLGRRKGRRDARVEGREKPENGNDTALIAGGQAAGPRPALNAPIARDRIGAWLLPKRPIAHRSPCSAHWPECSPWARRRRCSCTRQGIRATTPRAARWRGCRDRGRSRAYLGETRRQFISLRGPARPAAGGRAPRAAPPSRKTSLGPASECSGTGDLGVGHFSGRTRLAATASDRRAAKPGWRRFLGSCD